MDIFDGISGIVSTGILGTVGTFVASVVLKAIARREFREFIFHGLKTFGKALLNRAETTHRLFYNLDKYKGIAEKITFIGEPVKTKLFRILITTKLEAAREVITAWLNDSSNRRILRTSASKMAFQYEMAKLTDKIVKTYEERIPENFFKYLENRDKALYYFDLAYNGICPTECENILKGGVPCEPQCDKVAGFKTVHARNVESIENFIATIPECEGEKNSVLFSFYLNHIDSALYSAVHDAKKTFKNQNGRYKLKL